MLTATALEKTRPQTTAIRANARSACLQYPQTRETQIRRPRKKCLYRVRKTHAMTILRERRRGFRLQANAVCFKRRRCAKKNIESVSLNAAAQTLARQLGV